MKEMRPEGWKESKVTQSSYSNREFLKMQLFFSVDEQILRCNLTSTWACYKWKTNKQELASMGKLEPSNIAVRNENSNIWKTVWQFLKRFNIELPYDPAIQVYTYPREIKTYVHTKLCTQMHSSYYSYSQKPKQHKCSSSDDGLMKYCIYIQQNMI